MRDLVSELGSDLDENIAYQLVRLFLNERGIDYKCGNDKHGGPWIVIKAQTIRRYEKAE